MTRTDLGKIWEQLFRKQWEQQFPNTFTFRLKDQLTGYRETSQNPCDFLCMLRDKLFMIELKEHKGQSINFSAIPQYDRLLEYKNKENVLPIIIIWFSEQDKVITVPIWEAEKMVLDGEKSIGLRMLKKDYKKLYNIIEIPTIKKRVYLDCDFSVLLNLDKE